MQIVSKKTLKELENIIIRNNKAPNNTNVLANLTYKCVDDLKNYCLQNSDLHYRFLMNVLLTDFAKNREEKIQEFAIANQISESHVYVIRREIILRFLVTMQNCKAYKLNE